MPEMLKLSSLEEIPSFERASSESRLEIPIPSSADLLLSTWKMLPVFASPIRETQVRPSSRDKSTVTPNLPSTNRPDSS